MFKEMTLKLRLSLSFGAVLLGAICLIGLGYFNLSRMEDAGKWNVHTYEVLGASEQALLNMVNMETGMRGFAVSGKDEFLEPFRKGEDAFNTHFAKARQLTADNATQQERLARLAGLQQEFKGIADSIIAKRREVTAGKMSTEAFIAEFSAGRDKKAMDGFRAGIAEVMNEESALLVKRTAAADAASATTRAILLYGGLALVALVVGIAVLVTRSVLAQLGGEPAYAREVVRRVADGDMSRTIEVTSGGEASLLAAVRDMQVRLSGVVYDIQRASEAVAASSSQIARGNLDLSGRTEQQAGSLEETASSMEELTSTVKQNADNARQANALAASASDVATRGGAVVGEVVSTMEAINESAKKIVDIIGVIDGIAFQTNILALNAAVEAARAGEQGRGFAVVAAEVRTLAQRSANAAKEIKGLIGDSVEKVDAGAKLVDQAGATMQEIVDSVRRVTDIIGEIAEASREQSSGIEQINEAVTQMDDMTQQNASLVEEAAAASESLQDQAGGLSRLVSHFRIDAQAAAAQSALQSVGAMPAAASPAAQPARRPAPARPLQAARKESVKRVAETPKAAPRLAAVNGGEWEEF